MIEVFMTVPDSHHPPQRSCNLTAKCQMDGRETNPHITQKSGFAAPSRI